MLITITSEINPILYIVSEHYHPNTQCRIGLISEVIVISIVNPIPALFQSLFFAILSFHFFPKGFCACIKIDRGGTKTILGPAGALRAPAGKRQCASCLSRAHKKQSVKSKDSHHFTFWRNVCNHHPLGSGTYPGACTRHSRAATASSCTGISQQGKRNDINHCSR